MNVLKSEPVEHDRSEVFQDLRGKSWSPIFVFHLATILLALAGCTTPTRIDVDQFKSKFSGRIGTKDIPAFRGCVVDGFNPLQSYFYHPRLTRQQQLSSVSRIETLFGDGLLVSVDIHEDGRVELFETVAMTFVNRQPEHDTFNLCAEKYGKLKWPGSN